MITLLKYVLPLAIIVWLLARVDPADVSRVLQKKENWPSLAGGFSLTFLAICLSFVRWYVLVRALALPFRLADAFRLGFLGYLLTFVSGGSVGGDLFKAVFVAHEHPGRRPEAVATVLVDRIAGMVSLVLLTTTAILVGGPADPPPVVEGICTATLLATAVILTGLAVVLIPPHSGRLLLAIASRIPKAGSLLARLIAAVLVYRRRPVMLLLALALSLSSHLLLVFSMHLVARAVLVAPPGLSEHFIIVPLSLVAGTLPLTPGGLGTFELAMDQLYRSLPAAPVQDGVLVALAFRLMTIITAVIGGLYYVASRREVKQLLDEAELSQDAQESLPETAEQLEAAADS